MPTPSSVGYVPNPSNPTALLHLQGASQLIAMNDQTTTVNELRSLVRDFVDERDWQQFHSPKNISMALAIEAAELMEHFQWLTIDASRQLVHEPKKLAAVAEELADVLSYTLAMANSMGIDLAATIEAKMEKNAEKYPADAFRGRFGVIDDAR